jgi:DNA-binding Xre family transcriptional regulator
MFIYINNYGIIVQGGDLMSVNYRGLFQCLADRKINLSQMSDDLSLSSATRAKFQKGEYVSMQTLESICRYLGVLPNAIIAFETPSKQSELLSRLQAEQKLKFRGGIYHETQILLTYNSNHIEGSALSSDQTRYLFETNTIGLGHDDAINVDDIIEAQNHFRCVNHMIQTALEPLSEDLIKDLHKFLKTGTSDASFDWFMVGDYKRRPNTVGGLETTKPGNVAKEMASLIGLYESQSGHSFEDIIAFHSQFEAIHPFSDGNGRVGRLIAFKECLRYGYVPFTIDESIKMFYYRGLKMWNTEKGFLLDTCRAGQDKYQKLMDVFEIKI